MEGEPQKGTPSVPSRGIEAEAHPGTTGCNLHGQRQRVHLKGNGQVGI